MSDHSIWLATYSGLSMFDGERFRPYNRSNLPGMKSQECLVLKEGLKGGLWVGTTDGVLFIKQRRVESYHREDGLTHGYITAICPTVRHGVWVGTMEGLNQVLEGEVQRVDEDRVWEGKRILTLLEYPEGFLWVGFERGLYRMDLDNHSLEKMDETGNFGPTSLFFRSG